MGQVCHIIPTQFYTKRIENGNIFCLQQLCSTGTRTTCIRFKFIDSRYIFFIIRLITYLLK